MLKDADARKIISQSVKANLMVEAGAGSGKTHEMAKRVIALVGTGYRTINEIVAITFTRKAANELRERIRLMLRQDFDTTNNPLIKTALDHIHECFIGTVHSFCGKILRERPIEAGVAPDFEQIDEAKDLSARQKIWETYVMQANDDDLEILRLMDVFDVKVSAAKEFLKRVCENQDTTFVLPNEPETQFADLMNRVRDTAKEVCQAVAANYDAIPNEIIADSSLGDGLQKAMIRFKAKLRHITIEEMADKEVKKLVEIFQSKGSVKITQKKWGATKEEKEYAKDLAQQFAELQATVITPLLNDINHFVYNRVLLPFAMKANDLYQRHKATVGELNFQDMLIKSSNMLRDYPDVRKHFHEKYKTFMIDEFQDTDPIQVSITMYLTGEELTEKRWNMLTPKEGSLFVVGDPKQSIYKFRRADFSMYKRFKAHIVKYGGQLIELHTNFRASRALGSWYNKSFVDLFNHENQASFTSMDAIMPMLDNTLAGVTYYRLEEKKVSDVMQKEPENLTRIIKHLVGRKHITIRDGNDAQGNPRYTTRVIKYNDIMLLATKKKQVKQIGNGIAERGIPIKITGANIIHRTSEFISFCDLVRMFAYPEENAYVHMVMRGDFYRITDSEIYNYHRLGGRFSLYFDFKVFYDESTLSKDQAMMFSKIEDCFTKLKKYLDYVKSLSLAAATERIIEELGIIRMHLASGEKAAGLGSFISLIEKIRLKKITDIWGLEMFITELSAMIESGYEEEVDIEGKDFDAVQVMNAHKAKGLEAAIVILCAPCSGKTQSPTFHTRCVADENHNEQNFGYMRVDTNPGGGFNRAITYFEPAAWSEIENEAEEAEALERDRVLYVAATRPKNFLIIGDSAASDNPWEKLIDRMPEDTDNILNEIYDEEDEVEEAPPAPIFTEKTIEDIKRLRDDAFRANTPSFGVYKPSEEITWVQKSEGISHEQEVTILQNTMEVIFGTIMHRLFEVLIKNEPALADTIDSIVENAKDGSITKEFLESAVDKFKRSKLFTRLQNAETVYTEVPFSCKIAANNDYAGQTFGQDTYVTGIIDLVFKENGAWVIIDYKTYNETESSHDIHEAYKPQLLAYKEAWENITNERVSETEIFFVMKRNV